MMADAWDTFAQVERHPAAALTVSGDAWSEAAIPMRPWIAPGYLMRGTLTVLSGHGSAGKSLLCIAWAIALATGQTIGRFRPKAPVRVALFNVEDDDDEQRRRLSASLRTFNLTAANIAGRVFRLSPSPTGTLINHDDLSKITSATQLMNLLEEAIKAHAIDVVILDPLVELHTAGENDNTALRHVLARLREMAVTHNLSVCIVHHQRKGGQAGDPDAVRGASAIVGAARQVLTVATMTKEEALELGQPEDHRFRFLRVDGAKLNYSLPQEAEWYEKVEHELDNTELVAAATPWHPPTVGLTADVLIAAARALVRGIDRTPCSEGARSPEFYRTAFEREGIPRALHKEALDTLKQDGTIHVAKWRDPETRKVRDRLWARGNTFSGWVEDDAP